MKALVEDHEDDDIPIGEHQGRVEIAAPPEDSAMELEDNQVDPSIQILFHIFRQATR